MDYILRLDCLIVTFLVSLLWIYFDFIGVYLIFVCVCFLLGVYGIDCFVRFVVGFVVCFA